MHSSSEPKLIERELLTAYATQLLEKEESGCNALLRDAKALKEAFELLCNNGIAGSSGTKLLATFCDNILKSRREKLIDDAIEVAQYASHGGDGKTANTNVDKCLRALEDLDSQLLQASRNEADASIQLIKSKIGTVVNALDSLESDKTTSYTN